MVKIKRKVEMSFIELLNYVWSNEIKNKTFHSTYSGGSVFFDDEQILYLEHEVHKNEKFAVVIEEKIYEYTVLDYLYEYTNDNQFKLYKNTPLQIIKDYEDKEFWLKDGDTMTLLWKDGAMFDD